MFSHDCAIYSYENDVLIDLLSLVVNRFPKSLQNFIFQLALMIPLKALLSSGGYFSMNCDLILLSKTLSKIPQAPVIHFSPQITQMSSGRNPYTRYHHNLLFLIERIILCEEITRGTLYPMD